MNLEKNFFDTINETISNSGQQFQHTSYSNAHPPTIILIDENGGMMNKRRDQDRVQQIGDHTASSPKD